MGQKLDRYLESGSGERLKGFPRLQHLVVLAKEVYRGLDTHLTVEEDDFVIGYLEGADHVAESVAEMSVGNTMRPSAFGDGYVFEKLRGKT